METFTYGRIEIAYRDAGSGPAIIFLHNGGTSSTIWRCQIDALSPTRRVIALDLPGFGDSPLPEPAATLDELVETVAALITDEDLAPVTVVGNCMGSNIAVRLARSHSELISAVLAVNPLTAASFSGGGVGFTHTMKRLGAKPTRLVRGISRKVPVPRFVAGQVVRFQLGPKGIAKGLQHDEELIACQLRAEQMPALVDVLDDMDAYGILDRAEVDDQVPIWVAWGERNKVLSRAKASGLEQRLHAERITSIPGTGHLPMLEDPEAITGLIEDLMRSTTLAAEAS